jgi:hypothetical protein
MPLQSDCSPLYLPRVSWVRTVNIEVEESGVFVFLFSHSSEEYLPSCLGEEQQIPLAVSHRTIF